MGNWRNWKRSRFAFYSQEFESPILHQSIARLVKWYNSGFVILYWQFDSVNGHQTIAEYGSGHPLGLISRESQVRILPLQPL